MCSITYINRNRFDDMKLDSRIKRIRNCSRADLRPESSKYGGRFTTKRNTALALAYALK